MPETTTYARSTYLDVIDNIIFDTGDTNKLLPIPKEELQRWILLAEKDICEKLPVTDKMGLRLLKGVEDYAFADTTGIVGTGTVTFTGTSALGVGTKALTELVSGSNVTIGLETRRVITVTDDTHFTIESSFANAINGSTFRLAPRATEITNEVHQIYFIDHVDANGRYCEVKVRDIDYVLQLRSKYVAPPTNINTYLPYVAAPYTDGGRRFLKVYPSPDVDKTATLYTYLRVNPRVHKNDALTDMISLNEMYEPAIAEYVRMKIYSFLHDVKAEAKYVTLYNNELNTLRFALPNDGRMRMEYN